MTGEIILTCPFPNCDDRNKGHNHLYVNAEKGVFQCWLCGHSGRVSYLLGRFPELSVRIGFAETFPRTEQPGRTRTFIKLIYAKSILAQKAWTYLMNRGMTEEEIKEADVHLCYELSNRAIFPHPTGVNYFWSGRAVIMKSPSWLFPRRGDTILTKSQCLWGLESVEEQEEKVVWITEGIFDAIVTNGICVYGKIPSAIQLRAVMALKPEKVVIAFDRDAMTEALAVQKRLHPFVPTYVKRPQASDYGTYMKEGRRREKGEMDFT